MWPFIRYGLRIPVNNLMFIDISKTNCLLVLTKHEYLTIKMGPRDKKI